MNTLEVMTFAMCLFGMMALLLFAVFRGNTQHSKIYLIVSLFSILYCGFYITLIHSGLIFKVPHLYRTALPFTFFMNPALFFYVRSAVKGDTVFRNTFYLHLIPGVLATLAFIPLYMSTAQEKTTILQAYTQGETIFTLNEGLIPIIWLYWIASVLNIIYLILTFRMITSTPRGKSDIPRKWLLTVAVFVMVVSLTFFVLTFIKSQGAFMVFTHIYAFLGIALVIYLYMRPDILYGVKPDKAEESQTKSPLLQEAEIHLYIKRMEQYFDESKPYLKQDLSLNSLAESLDIPRNKLSWLINQHYGMNFNEFINNHRIDHILRNFSTDQFKRLTMEGIAHEAGFRSRNTFIMAVKKRSGQTPSEFFSDKNYV